MPVWLQGWDVGAIAGYRIIRHHRFSKTLEMYLLRLTDRTNYLVNVLYNEFDFKK
jgi:hypothetical protein